MKKTQDETYSSLPSCVHKVYATYSRQILDTKCTLTNAEVEFLVLLDTIKTHP